MYARIIQSSKVWKDPKSFKLHPYYDVYSKDLRTIISTHKHWEEAVKAFNEEDKNETH